jgi:hypothetical protein
MTESDSALSATNYTPPSHVAANSDIQALIAQAVQQALAQQTADQQAASAPKVVSPEEKAHAAVVKRGVGLGVEERLAEIYEVLHHLLTKGA